MEDEQGDVGPSEPLVESMGGENQVEGSYEEGDGGEIMVEIVGSDVFVGGVSGQKDDYLRSGEVGDFEGHDAWENRKETAISEAMDVWIIEEDGNKMGDSEKTAVDCGMGAEFVDEREVVAAESKDSVLEMDSLVSDVQDENQGCLKEFDGIKIVQTHEVDDASHASPESRHEKTFVNGRGEVNVLDFKDGALDVILPDNDQCLKNDGELETVVVHQNHVFSNESTQQADGGDIDEMRNMECINIETQTSKVEEVAVRITEKAEVPSHASILPERTEKAESYVSTDDISLLDGGDIKETWVCDDAAIFSDKTNKPVEAEDTSGKLNGFYVMEDHISGAKPMDVEGETESDRTYNGGMVVDYTEPELGTEEADSETKKFELPNEEAMKSARSLGMHQPAYLSPPENDGHFAQSDLVWGKVRSHPWWPGQIFNPEDASEKAVKYYKKDSYLVAYFGDQTFAWNDASVLKPFRSYFPQIEKQTNSEAFQNAVKCVLEEVSRRVELGLACSCIPKDAYARIETQIVENTGIREESSRRYGVDQSSRAASFEPDKLLEYVRHLASRPSREANRLDLVIAIAQLSAFCSFKGYRLPTEFPSSGELLENDTDTEHISDEVVTSHKRKHTPKDASHSRKKRSMTELMGGYAEDESAAENLGKSVSLSSGRKRKTTDPLANGSDKRVSIRAAKISTSKSQTPKPSFKIGECIRRVASQLTRSTSLVRGNDDEMVIDGSPEIDEQSEKQVASGESFSVNEMLSQLQLVAQDPKKGNNFRNSIHTFFSGFRSSIALNKRGRKRKAEPTTGGPGEEFEFDDVNDSYWTDRIVHNYSEDQLLPYSENGAGNLQLAPFSAEKSVKSGHKPQSRKRSSIADHPIVATELDDENVKRRKQESSPAELILNFAERKCVPSEINLNKIFRRFGPLMESETEVDHDSGRAKVIFKRGSDAEVAHNSAEKFNIFGPALVNYQIGYSPVISVKILPLTVPQCQENESLAVPQCQEVETLTL